MGHVETTRIVNGALAPTWTAISKMGAVQDWHPNVARAEVLTSHDTGLGASRRVEFHDGNSVVETVVEESAEKFTTVEMTQSAPLGKALITISLREQSAETTEVTFSIDYTVKYGPIGWLIDAVMMKRMFGSVFEVALGGLSYHLETGESSRIRSPATPDRA